MHLMTQFSVIAQAFYAVLDGFIDVTRSHSLGQYMCFYNCSRAQSSLL